jgi:hypothetical protein
VTWVHPSWRDLVIDHLARSPERRRGFLDACGLPGVELALSTAGGPAGARRLPLVAADDDWDALGDAVHRLCLVLAQDELARLLAALNAAMADADTPDLAELQAITEMALNTVRRRLDREASIIDPGLLERWHALAHQLGEPPRPPDPAATLAALEPTGAHPADAASVRRLENFLAVIEATGQPLPPGIDEELAAFVAAAELADPLSAGTLAALRRLARVHHDLAARIWPLLDEDAVRQAQTSFDEPTMPPMRPDADARRVRRILADL